VDLPRINSAQGHWVAVDGQDLGIRNAMSQEASMGKERKCSD
jgi:hypothetical protein